MAATDPLVPGARARALREYVSVPESTNIARLRAFAADMWIALVRRNEIASEKAMEKPGDCKFFSGNTTGDRGLVAAGVHEITSDGAREARASEASSWAALSSPVRIGQADRQTVVFGTGSRTPHPPRTPLRRSA